MAVVNTHMTHFFCLFADHKHNHGFFLTNESCKTRLSYDLDHRISCVRGAKHEREPHESSNNGAVDTSSWVPGC